MSPKPVIIGITGGISSGKSTVGRMLASMGAEYLDADEMCHRLFFTKGIKDRVVERFGDTVQDAYGKIDRTRLAEIVFRDKACLDDLCAILHPVVIGQIRAKIDEIEKQGRRRAVVIDAALLEESELSLICDFIIFVNTGKERRRERSHTGRRWSPDELEKRERFQMDLEKKKKSADYIIDNNFTVENTSRQVMDFWQLYIDPYHRK